MLPLPYEGPRGRGRPRRTTRELIAATALRLFRSQGVEATTVEQIAAACGIGRSTFFRYFGSKAELITDRDAAELVALGERLRDSAADPEPLLAAVRAVIAAVRSLPPEPPAVMADRLAVVVSSPERLAEAGRWSELRVAAIRDHLAAALGQDAFDLVPLGFAHAVDAAVLTARVRFARDADRSLPELLAEGLAAVLDGFHGGGARTAGSPGSELGLGPLQVRYDGPTRGVVA